MNQSSEQKPAESAPALTCAYCRKPMDKPVIVAIHLTRRVYGKRQAVTEPMKFCSAQCGGYYQMGSEG